MAPSPDPATDTIPAPAADLSTILQPILDEAVVACGVDGAAISLPGADGGPDRRVYVSGVVGEALIPGQQVVARQRAVADFVPVLVATVPVRPEHGDGEGTLCLFARAPRRLTVSQDALMRWIARSATLAIENAWLAASIAEADARHRFLLDRLPDAIWAAGADRVFTYLSAGIEALLGYAPEELLGRSSGIVMHESSRQAFEDGYRWQIEHPDADQTYRVNLRHKDGHPVPVELHNIGTPVDGRYGGGTGSVREISERLRLEREIEQQAAELAAGRERAHLAQELHDSVTQALFSMTMTAGAARRLVEQDRPGVDAKLDELSELAREALAEMRGLIFELRPGNLAEEGFEPALRKHLTAIQGRTGLVVRLDVDPDLGRLPAAIEGALYRIAQEAIHNVVKHAGAREAQVRVARLTREVLMTVSDDGTGFDAQIRTDGLGLPGMAARAERLGGRAGVESSPGGGTTVSVVLPL
jgi:PAS domain S-box-containing protein